MNIFKKVHLIVLLVATVVVIVLGISLKKEKVEQNIGADLEVAKVAAVRTEFTTTVEYEGGIFGQTPETNYMKNGEYVSFDDGVTMRADGNNTVIEWEGNNITCAPVKKNSKTDALIELAEKDTISTDYDGREFLINHKITSFDETFGVTCTSNQALTYVDNILYADKVHVDFNDAITKQGYILEKETVDASLLGGAGDSHTIYFAMDYEQAGYEIGDMKTIDPSDGPNSSTNIGEDQTVGTYSWTNPDNIKTQNDTDAGATTGNATSYYITADTFSFTITNGATIVGVVAEYDTSLINDVDCSFNSVKLIENGSVAGDEHASDDSWNNGDDLDAYQVFGGATELWGLTLSEAEVEANDFGVAMAVAINGNRGSCAVDHVRMTVYFTEPPAAPDAPTSVTLTPSSTSLIVLDGAWTKPNSNPATSGYRIDLRAFDEVGFTTINADTATTSEAYEFTGLNVGWGYEFQVYAINTEGTSPASASAFATTTADHLRPNGDNSVAWTPSSGTDNFALIDDNLVSGESPTSTGKLTTTHANDSVEYTTTDIYDLISPSFTPGTITSSTVYAYVENDSSCGIGCVSSQMFANINCGGAQSLTALTPASFSNAMDGWHSASFPGLDCDSTEVESMTMTISVVSEYVPVGPVPTYTIEAGYADVRYEVASAPAPTTETITIGKKKFSPVD